MGNCPPELGDESFMEQPTRLSEDALRADLERVIEMVDGPPTMDEYDAYGAYSAATLGGASVTDPGTMRFVQLDLTLKTQMAVSPRMTSSRTSNRSPTSPTRRPRLPITRRMAPSRRGPLLTASAMAPGLLQLPGSIERPLRPPRLTETTGEARHLVGAETMGSILPG